MALPRGFRFTEKQDVAFPKGLLLSGDIEPDNEYQSQDDRAHNRAVVQRTDEVTGKRMWKATVTDPDERKAKRSSFEIHFVADVQPVPYADEVWPGTGMRPVELEGLELEPKVAGQGEFKYLTYAAWATGIKDTRTNRKGSAGSTGSASQSGVAA